MKSIYILISLSLLMLCGAIAATFFFHRDAKILTGYVMDIKEYAQRSDEKGVKDSVDSFSALWESCDHYWEFFCDHDDLDRVSELLVDIRYAMKEPDFNEIARIGSQLILVVQNIREKEVPRWENII